MPTQVAYDNRSVKGANGDVEILRRFPPANNTGGVPSIIHELVILQKLMHGI